MRFCLSILLPVSIWPGKDEIEFNNRYAKLQKQIVIEITEEESIDYHALETKKNAPGFEGAFALDDYGSGYSNEKSLLDLAPKYIKVDLSIIRDIDTDPDKQQIVENIVAYAHKRDMKIVAEGLETPEESGKYWNWKLIFCRDFIWHVRNQFLEISMKMH